MIGQICKVVKPDYRKGTTVPFQLPLSYCCFEEGAIVLILSNLHGGFVSVLAHQGEKVVSLDYLEPCLPLKNSLWDL